jgi:hypothetical protein
MSSAEPDPAMSNLAELPYITVDDGWLFQAVPEGGRLRLESLDFACDLDAVYEDVSFEPAEQTTD